jgi:hypothetical protein
MRLVIILVSLAALGLGVVLGGMGPAYRFGLVDLGGAFGLIRQLTLPTLAAAGAGALVFLLSLWKARGLSLLALVATAVAGGAGYAPAKMKAMADANPFIHDITTDFENPPAIVAAAGLPRSNPPDYVGAEKVRETEKTVAEAQREAFPDIRAFNSDQPVLAVRLAVGEILDDMKMTILAETPAGADGEGVIIEAVHTSLWFGFKDDFIVRIAPIETGSRVDVRSKSRVGGSDLGANAARVRKFLAELDKAV